MSDLTARVKEDKQTTKDNESLILYFDILGYKQKFEEDDFDQAEFLKSIYGVVAKAREIEKDKLKIYKNVKVKIKIFSDNFVFVFSGGSLKEKMNKLGIVLSNLQAELLSNHEMLFRGSIIKGDIEINDDFVFGKGLIDAYNLECKAEYPRVVIGSELIKFLGKDDYIFQYYKDYDGRYAFENLLNQFPQYISLDNVERTRNVIIKLLAKYGNYKNIRVTNERNIYETEKTIRKYLWVVESFNNFCDHINKSDISKKKKIKFESISYDLLLNKKFMRAEIANIK